MALIQIGRLLFPPTQLPEYNTNFDQVDYDDVADTIVISNSLTGVSVSIGQAKVAVSTAAANQAYFATAPAVAFPIGTVLAIINYNATTDGVTVQKTSLAAGTFADWIVTATEDFASTGHIGQNPA